MCHIPFKYLLVLPISFLGIVLWLTVPSEAFAKTYYTATTGSDANSCAAAQNAATPKRTINAGADCLSGGDTLIVQPGTYDEILRNPLPSGPNPQNPTTLMGPSTTQHFTLRPTMSESRVNGVYTEYFIQIGENYSNLRIANIIVDGRAKGGRLTNAFTSSGNNVVLENCELVATGKTVYKTGAAIGAANTALLESL